MRAQRRPSSGRRSATATPTVRPFEKLRPEEEGLAGGKAATLARLYRAGHPVPHGIVVLPTAFVGDDLSTEAWAAVVGYLRSVWSDDRGARFAVRSSAAVEDSARASYAGQFETVLDTADEDAVRDAIAAVRRSRDSERVRAYGLAKGMPPVQRMAVIVQRMVPAELSGVLFTADPVTGSRSPRSPMSGSLVRGVGDRLVSGAATGEAFTLERRRGAYGGPPELACQARELARLATQLEKTSGQPQDIEFAVAGGELFLLQSRPITTAVAYDPTTGEWNDSRGGDFLWTNVNFGEAVSAPMTPLTWTVIRRVLADWTFLPGHESAGNIGGRPYLNLSVFASVFHVLGKSTRELLDTLEPTIFTRLPAGMEIPLIALPRWAALRHGPRWMGIEIRQRAGLRALARYVTSNPAWCRRMTARTRDARTPSELACLWRHELLPHVERGVWIVLGSAARYARVAAPLRRELGDLVGPEDADSLFLDQSEPGEGRGAGGPPANLGPLLGIARVAAGELSREDYLDLYGHRGPDEFELSTPRPIEDPRWLERQIELHGQPAIDVAAMLRRRQARFAAAWSRLETRFPRRAGSFRRRIARACSCSRRREAARSEYVRDRWLVRVFALRAAELTGLGSAVFFLTLDELVAALDGKQVGGEAVAAEVIAARRETHRRYCGLPPYPALIRGRFEPHQWAADPHRRSDFFDSRVVGRTDEEDPAEVLVLHGAAGSAGRVEGVVRLLDTTSEGFRLRAGEVLVATQTDIEWTPLFPLAAAIVTDVGAPFSHAAVVARELGVPAVVGCGDATMRLRTGDRVLVDGGRGEVRVLEAARGARFESVRSADRGSAGRRRTGG